MELELGLRVIRRAHNPTFKCVETATTFIILVYLSGVQENDIEMEINEEGTEISISSRGGRSFQERVITGPVQLRTDIDNRRFKKVFKIPDGIAVDKIRARFDEQGILYIYMPKLAQGCYIGYIVEIKQEEEIGEEEDTAESEPEEVDNEDIGLKEEKPESGHFDSEDHSDDKASTQLEEPCTDGDDNGDVFPENLETEEIITSSVEENKDELYESCEEAVKEEEIVVTEDASDNGKEESSSDEINEEVKKGNEEESEDAEQLQAPEESEEKQVEVIRNENSSDDKGKQPAEESEASPSGTEEKPPDPIQTDDLQQDEESCEGDQIPDKMERAASLGIQNEELETSEIPTPNPSKEEESSDATEERELEKPGEELSDEIEEKQTDTPTNPTEEPQAAASTPPVDDITPTETETPNPNPATEEESSNASTKEEDNNTIKGEEEVSTSPEQQQSEDETTPTGTGTGTSNPNPNPTTKEGEEEMKTSNPNPRTKEGEKEIDTRSDRAEEEGEGMGGERKVRRGGGGRPPFPLSDSALMMGSAFILSLVVLVLHFLNRDGRTTTR